MKRLIVLLAVFLLSIFSICHAGAATVGTDTYAIDELDMSIDIPSDYIVFTRDIDSNDPNLDILGVTKEEVTSLLENWNMYLNAKAPDGMVEITINMPAEYVSSIWFSCIDEDSLSVYLSSEIASNSSDSGYHTLKSEIYNNNQIKYIKLYSNSTEEDIFGLTYYTVYQNKAFYISMLSNSGEINESDEASLKDIVDSIVFDNPPDFSQTAIQATAQLEARKQAAPGSTNNALYKGLVGAGSALLIGTIAWIFGFIKRLLNKNNNSSLNKKTTKNEESRLGEKPNDSRNQSNHSEQISGFDTSTDFQYTAGEREETISINLELKNQINQCKQVYPLFDFEREIRRRTTGRIFSNLIRSGVNVTTAYESIFKQEV